MGADEPFEPLDPELRSVLRELASEPAPDRLLDRVAAIPEEVPVVHRRSVLRLAGSLAAAAAVFVLVGAALALGPLGRLPFGGGPATPAPSGAPMSTPGASPSAAGSPPPVASASPGSSPSPSAAASPSGSPGPSGFQARSVTFASPDLGWALGTARCTQQPCVSLAGLPTIERTKDAGRTWGPVPGPDVATIVGGTSPGTPAGSGVSELRFADPLDGWAYGPDLWATHDGGVTWHRLPVPGGSGATIVALEAAAGTVHAVIADTGGFRIASSPVATDAWRLSAVTLPYGAGPVPDAQLVLSGTGGWVLQVDRVVVDGARLAGGSWVGWTPPCADVVGPAVLGASSASDLVAACDVGAWATPKGVHLYASSDGGTTFQEVGASIPLTGLAGITTSGPAVVLVNGSGATGASVVGSFDGGRTWATVLASGEKALTDLGFTTATQGVVVAPYDTTSAGLYMTRDGGHTWSAVTFSGG